MSAEIVKLTPKPRRKLTKPEDDPRERAKLEAAYISAKSAHYTIPALRAAGLAQDLCDELDKATSERAVRLLALLAMSGDAS